MRDPQVLLDEIEMLADHPGVLSRLTELRQWVVETQADIRIALSEISEGDEALKQAMDELNVLRGEMVA